MSKRSLEIWVGLFVTAGVAALIMLAMKVSNLSSMSTGDTYQIYGQFENIGGLTIRSPVKASGVLVGRVSDIKYDDNGYHAVVTMSIEKQFNKFPIDTSASIYTAGLLGEQYIGLTPGAEEEYLVDGDTVMFADAAVILEKLIGRIMVDKLSK